MRKILVPTDFSDNAFNALKYACHVFKYEKSEIFIMHAYADEVYQQDRLTKRSLLDELKEKTQRKSEEKLNEVLERIRHEYPNPHHKYKTISAFGSLIDEVNDLVNLENLDIVVMATRGATNDRSLTFGSNTLQVLKYISCPVLAIPEGYTYHAPKELLFPTNYLVPYKRRELKLLCEMSGSFRSTIHMLYIDPIKKLTLRQEDNQQFLKECLPKARLVFETTEEKDKTIAITKYIVHKNIDMLVLVNTRHSFVEDMLTKSTLDKIGLHIKIPFLVMQNLFR
ncbi:universal stress protein [Maribacter polysiphoniae]|uniref:Nucleotide-binding universal stress UspA family protein n=1 Tax=Maribacter polysiphoniae TaxID=429344 RepID=A0A316E4T2_9FLAO|nr:universal stress protein [Maribacter polysiphoniae]MBD1261046.1 universal stress protein [Maribacter polysiphoniae]PWK23713.1 nucleotide-binding universal stress UspA family protein [Maribacter polysiphoniae]